MLFISHRSTDKVFADLFSDFLLRCGIKSDYIFCSSLPGNDIKANIPVEIKNSLHKSVLNIVFLSVEYYKSPYCLNEEGIIWYLDIPIIVIGLPEVNENVMEGFLNSDNKIRRLDNRLDVLAITDIVRSIFSDFINSVAKLNDNIDKLIKDYQISLGRHTLLAPKENPSKVNSLEDKILADDFLSEELVALRYMYDKKQDIFSQNELTFLEWIKDHKIEIASSIDIAEFLANSKIAKWENEWSIKLTPEVYRNLIKLSEKALDFTNKAIANLTKKSKQKLEDDPNNNYLDQLITNSFTDNEILFIKYVMDSERVKFMCGWQIEQEIQKIQAWEDVNSIKRALSRNYGPTTDRLLMRKIIKVSQETSYGNPKEYELTNDTFNKIEYLDQASKRKIETIIEKNKLPDIDEKLAF